MSARISCQLTFFAEFLATCRTDNAVSHPHARRQRQAACAHRQYPCGFESCQGCCGAVASDGSLEDVLGLRGGQNHPTSAALASARSHRIGRVTAGFRMITTCRRPEAHGIRFCDLAARHADRHRAHRRARAAFLQQRQDHRACGVDLVPCHGIELGVLDVVDAQLGQHVMVDR